MSKNKHPQKHPIIDQEDGLRERKLTKQERIKSALGRELRLDASHYMRMPKYEGKQFMWINDKNGEVEKWLRNGAALVPRETGIGKEWEGFSSRNTGQWECVEGTGTLDSGALHHTYLLIMDAEDYNEIKIEPLKERQREILAALGRGKTKDAAVGGGLKTYAPAVDGTTVGIKQANSFNQIPTS